MSDQHPTVLLEGLSFPEAPRWHDGRLYLSDFYAHRVLAVGTDGKARTIVEVPQQPSGIGWMQDGTLLVVSMLDRKVMKWDGRRLSPHADLAAIATGNCNDMVVDAQGRAYVGNFGFNSHAGDDFKLADLIRVDPDGTASVAAAGLAFPNGSVITPDGGTLIVGETRGHILSAWDRAADGSLSNRRVWADLDGGYPDGICLDAEGAVWVADPRNKETIRVLEGGEVTERISTGDYGSFACMLGGEDRRTLFICTCLQSGPGTAELRSGRIETVQVEVPGAGWP